MSELFLVSQSMKTQRVRLACRTMDGLRDYFVPFAQASLGPSSYLGMMRIAFRWLTRDNDSKCFLPIDPLQLEAVGGAAQLLSFPHTETLGPITCKYLVAGRGEDNTLNSNCDASGLINLGERFCSLWYFSKVKCYQSHFLSTLNLHVLQREFILQRLGRDWQPIPTVRVNGKPTPGKCGNKRWRKWAHLDSLGWSAF